MFCVIQEIQRKKPNAYGYRRELVVDSYDIGGKRKYSHRYAGERFERPIMTAYKLSIHESRRVDGVVTKRQFPVTTFGYYDLVEYWIGDCIKPGKLEAIAASLDTSPDALWTLINAKVDPLEARIKAEFDETPEGKAHAEHEEILRIYHSQKEAFSKGWGVDPTEYDYCYDVFGNVMNQAHLDQIMKMGKHKEQAYRSYQKASSGNYSGYDYSKLFGSSSDGYSAEDKARLKAFYKSLSKIYHPDMNRDVDTHAEMVLLNRLKQEWGV